MTQNCQKTITCRVSNFVHFEVIRMKKHQIKYHSLQSYQNVFSFENYVRSWQSILMFFVWVKKFKNRQKQNKTIKMLKCQFSQSQRWAWRSFIHAMKIAMKKFNENDKNTIRNLTNEAIDYELSNTNDNESKQSLSHVERLCLNFCISLLN